MTREEAIKGLKVLRNDFSGYKPNEEMFDMAIEALETDVPDTNVGDTISRQAAIDALCKRCDLVSDDDEPCTEECNDIKILKLLPSAQPVIRCKDCKHFGGGTYCHERDGLWDENAFCSYAERKEQDDG